LVPIVTEIAAEHRMYLPLAAPLAMVGIWAWTRQKKMAAGLMVCAVGALAAATIARNADYRTAERIWRQTVAERPLNPRAHYNLAYSLAQSGHAAEAAGEYQAALRLAPDYYAAEIGLSQALLDAGDIHAAEHLYQTEIAANGPLTAEGHLRRGILRLRQKDWTGAREDFQALVALRPNDAEARYLLDAALRGSGH
jgi:tetratricopeptide (TPR) repeat protein